MNIELLCLWCILPYNWSKSKSFSVGLCKTTKSSLNETRQLTIFQLLSTISAESILFNYPLQSKVSFTPSQCSRIRGVPITGLCVTVWHSFFILITFIILNWFGCWPNSSILHKTLISRKAKVRAFWLMV